MARAAYEDGARGLLLAPPFFMKNIDDDGLFNWFRAVFEKIGSPLKGVVLYHIPGQTAVPLSVSLVSRIRAAYPGIVTGIKDSSGEPISTIFEPRIEKKEPKSKALSYYGEKGAPSLYSNILGEEALIDVEVYPYDKELEAARNQLIQAGSTLGVDELIAESEKMVYADIKAKKRIELVSAKTDDFLKVSENYDKRGIASLGGPGRSRARVIKAHIVL